MSRPQVYKSQVRDVEFGARVKFVEPVNLYECKLGDDCFIGHGVMFINDNFRSGAPAGGDKAKWRSTSIGDRVSIGSNATLLPVRVCSDVVIGAGAVVTRDIERPGIYAGNPARFLRGHGGPP